MEKVSINNALNIFKGIACIFVVFMHCEFPGDCGTFIQCVGRFAVPFFFSISGYFCYYPSKDRFGQKFSHKLHHIVRITLISSVVYFIWAVLKSVLISNPSSIFDFLFIKITKFLIFNEPFFISGHLWFLFALLYSYFLMYIVYKYIGLNSILTKVLAGVLLFTYFAVSYGFHLYGVKIPNCVYRNFLLEGFPLMLLGYYIHENQLKIISKITKIRILLLLSSGVILSVVERVVLGRDFGMHIGSILILVSLLFLSIKYSGTNRWKIFRILGEKYSLWVYVMHILIWNALYCMAKILHIADSNVYLWMQPIIVVIATIISGMIFYKIKDRRISYYESRYSK